MGEIGPPPPSGVVKPPGPVGKTEAKAPPGAEVKKPPQHEVAEVTDRKVNHANALRNILRQDPNIILVGEIRDTETAKIAFRASLTGHLVFSTLHE